MDYYELTEEQKDKARACRSADELMELAEAEGAELSDEQLEALAGGGQCEGYTERYCADLQSRIPFQVCLELS